jgi:hypothetical protein
MYSIVLIAIYLACSFIILRYARKERKCQHQNMQDQACLIYMSLMNAVLLVPAVIIEVNRKREREIYISLLNYCKRSCNAFMGFSQTGIFYRFYLCIIWRGTAKLGWVAEELSAFFVC